MRTLLERVGLNEPTYRQRVRAGAELLDRHSPGWAEKVDPGYLMMSSGSQCVLGQVFGGYGVGCAELERKTNGDGFDPYRLAFVCKIENDEMVDPQEYTRLRDLWREEVAARV